jgi:hypothetical protein
MSTIYFVTEAYLKSTTNVGQNVDMQNVTPLIQTAADMWVRSILGTYFYNYLLTGFNAQTLNADEIILVGYIKPAVAWRTASDTVFNTSFQVKNKGVQTQSGDFSASPDFKSVSFIAHQTREKSEFYDNRLNEYLCENKALYPQFTSDLNRDSSCRKTYCEEKTSLFQSGITFI